MTCSTCDHAREHGWWGQNGTHCGLDQRGPDHDCHRSWTARAQSHCSECHRHFGSDSAGDAHRVGDTCRDPKGFDRWETPDGPIWGGRDPQLMASLRALRGSRDRRQTAGSSTVGEEVSR